MKYEEFKTNIVAELREFYGADATVEVTTSAKNNGIKLEGIIIRIGEANVSPIIYLQQYYDEFVESGDSSIDDIVGKIVEMREKHDLKNADEVIEQITNWSYVRDRIYCMVVSSENGNEERLSQFVTRTFLDLAVILYVKLDAVPCIGGEATVKITKQMMDSLGVSEDEAFDRAFENMKTADGYNIQDIFSVIMGMVDTEVPMDDSREKMFVLTNTNKSLGAAGILLLESDFMVDMLKDSCYYILPSSIHEVLLIPETDEIDVEMLKNMVIEVNETTVASEEKLSDSVYLYSADTRKISIVA